MTATKFSGFRRVVNCNFGSDNIFCYVRQQTTHSIVGTTYQDCDTGTAGPQVGPGDEYGVLFWLYALAPTYAAAKQLIANLIEERFCTFTGRTSGTQITVKMGCFTALSDSPTLHNFDGYTDQDDYIVTRSHFESETFYNSHDLLQGDPRMLASHTSYIGHGSWSMAGHQTENYDSAPQALKDYFDLFPPFVQPPAAERVDIS